MNTHMNAHTNASVRARMAAPSHPPPLRRNYVLLRAGALRLLLPQQDLGSTEYLDSTPLLAAAPGVFAYGEGAAAIRVMALSERMLPLHAFPRDRDLLTRMSGQQEELAFAWNDVRVLLVAGLEQHALPAVMQVPNAPIDAYVKLDGQLALCSTAEQLLAYVHASRR